MTMRWQHLMAAIGILGLAVSLGQAQKFEARQREDAREMLHTLADDIRKHYYDPGFHGIDFEALVREADQKIRAASNLNQAFAAIGWAFDGLQDSHTYFVPPLRPIRVEYGWRMEMVGNRCYVTEVRPKSDAEAKGLKVGDELLALNGVAPTRDNLLTMQYIFNVLAPRPTIPLMVRSVDGQQRQISVDAKIRLKRTVDLTGGAVALDSWDRVQEMENANRLRETRCTSIGDDLAVCMMPEFSMEDDEVRNFFRHVHNRKSLILDLRNNPGGDTETLAHMLGGFFDHGVKVGERVQHTTRKPEVVKPGHDRFSGDLIVLVDSKSASAAEIFARVIQLEKRGKVLGDRTSGLVMEGQFYGHHLGAETGAYYGAVITDADIVMTDGKSLERNGVTPDELLVPTQADLSKGEDPVLAHAAELLGAKLTPEKAGKLFPYQWPSE